jgi:hypothetical protein
VCGRSGIVLKNDKAVANLSARSELLGFRRDGEEVLLGYDAALLGNWYQTFRDNMPSQGRGRGSSGI